MECKEHSRKTLVLPTTFGGMIRPDPTRKGNYHVRVMVDIDTTCGICKRLISVGTACTAVYLAKGRKGTLLGHRCIGECTEGRRIDELPPGSLTC